MKSARDYGTLRRERAALIKAQFGFVQAFEMTGRAPIESRGLRCTGESYAQVKAKLAARCPSCHEPSAMFLTAAPFSGSRSFVPPNIAADYAEARAFICGFCRVQGDAIDYVAAARAWPADRALRAAQDWLEGRHHCGSTLPQQVSAPPTPRRTMRLAPAVFRRASLSRHERVFGINVKGRK